MNACRFNLFQPGEISVAATNRNFRMVQPEPCGDGHLKKMGAVWK